MHQKSFLRVSIVRENKDINTLILWAIIESLKADGYEAEVKEVEQSAGSV